MQQGTIHNYLRNNCISILLFVLQNPIVLAGSQDGTAYLANVSTKRILSKFNHDLSDSSSETTSSIESVEFDQNQFWAYTAATDSRLGIWDLNTGTSRTSFFCSGGAVKLLTIPELHLVAVTTNVGCVDFFDPRTDKIVKQFSGHKGIVFDIASEGTTFITAGDDSTIKLYDITKT